MLSALSAEFASNPQNCGPLENATHFGTSGCRGEGPYVEIWLDLQNGIIRHAAYRTPGCPSSRAAASTLVALITGRKLELALLLTGGELLRVLGGLPEGKEGYAGMAVEALQNAAISPAVLKESA